MSCDPLRDWAFSVLGGFVVLGIMFACQYWPRRWRR